MGVALKGLGSYVGRGHRGCKHDLQQPQHCGGDGKRSRRAAAGEAERCTGERNLGDSMLELLGKKTLN